MGGCGARRSIAAKMGGMAVDFDQVGRIPEPGDNVAIASRRLEAGTRIKCGGREYELTHTVLEGHRFVHDPIAAGGSLLSWGLPFGTATRDIAPGEYVCNAKILRVLAGRHVDFDLPDAANFEDYYQAYAFDPGDVEVTEQVERHGTARYFEGFDRGGRRGVGTRNMIVVLGTTSLTGGFAQALADRFKDAPGRFGHIDGVVAVAHTEGGEGRPNNLDLTLRTLSGFMVHPNVGAVLAVDCAGAAVTNAMLVDHAKAAGRPLDEVLHEFLTLDSRISQSVALDRAAGIVEGWLAPVNEMRRTRQSAAHLNLALQCGGSDAFSGVSGNPLVGWIAREVLRYGGKANIAETTELIGAERYMLRRVRDLETARGFLKIIDRYKQRAGWHGHDAEGNTSGGNNFRGLYNIAVKSIGAARKKAPDVRLDAAIDYAAPMDEPGFYFMDSPGNDLESIAGQVAAGGNMILFTTGNGSITNFPFVPTLKVITTSDRYGLIKSDMDINAGRYQDGESMDVLGAESLDLLLDTASGRRSLGERAGHWQVQLWRDWRQTGPGGLEAVRAAPAPRGEALAMQTVAAPKLTFSGYRTASGYAADQVGAIVPTSLCAAQVSRMIVDRLNAMANRPAGVSRFVSFVHTEGCGVSSGDNEELYLRTIVGHALHPSVRCGVFLEHGCEKTHNDAMRHMLGDSDVDADRFGWASIQLDGGIESAAAKVMAWFDEALGDADALEREEAGLGQLRLGLMSVGAIDESVAAALARVGAVIVSAGGTVVAPENATLLGCEAVTGGLLAEASVAATLSYGERAAAAGFHVMATPTRDAAETVTGLGATGVDVVLMHAADRPTAGHPMIPTAQVTSGATGADFDRVVEAGGDVDAMTGELLELVLDVASGRTTPVLSGQGYDAFQITRGLTGISL